MAINGHANLMEIKGGGGLRRGNSHLMMGSEGGASLRLDVVFECGEGTTDPAVTAGGLQGRG
jgi:hypothetical protein